MIKKIKSNHMICKNSDKNSGENNALRNGLSVRIVIKKDTNNIKFHIMYMFCVNDENATDL